MMHWGASTGRHVHRRALAVRDLAASVVRRRAALHRAALGRSYEGRRAITLAPRSSVWRITSTVEEGNAIAV